MYGVPTLMLVPLLEAKVKLVDTSKPVGAVTVIPVDAVMLAPVSEKLVVEEAVPYVVLSAGKCT